MLTSLVVTGCASTSGTEATKSPATSANSSVETAAAQPVPSQDEIKAEQLPAGEQNAILKKPEDYGIKLESVNLIAADIMVQMRYRVIDPLKAHRIINRKVKPFMIDQATGVKYDVPRAPKVGTLRYTGSNLTAGRAYNIMFANPGRSVKRGSEITVVIGDLRLENLKVN